MRALGDALLEQPGRLHLVADVAQHPEDVRPPAKQKRRSVHLDVEDAPVLVDLARAGAELPPRGNSLDVLGKQVVIVGMDERGRVDSDQLVVVVASRASGRTQG